MKKQLLFLLLLTPLLGCYNDKEADLYPAATCDASAVHFSTNVSKICADNCTTAGCHNATTNAGGYNFTSYADAQRAAQNGLLVGTITHTKGSPMPLNAPQLPDCDIAQIKSWVADGAPNN